MFLPGDPIHEGGEWMGCGLTIAFGLGMFACALLLLGSKVIH